MNLLLFGGGNYMFKISSKASVSISIVLSILLFVLCLAGAVIMPYFIEMFIDVRGLIVICGNITQTGRILVYILAYMALAVVMLADVLLFSLLMLVRSGDVFTSKSVSFIRGVSWCCFLLGLIFCGLGIYFQMSFIVAFVAVVLGVCLRVVKNVIEEATEIKSENDLTV